jgi:hypothetical protein
MLKKRKGLAVEARRPGRLAETKEENSKGWSQRGGLSVPWY